MKGQPALINFPSDTTFDQNTLSLIAPVPLGQALDGDRIPTSAARSAPPSAAASMTTVHISTSANRRGSNESTPPADQ